MVIVLFIPHMHGITIKVHTYSVHNYIEHGIIMCTINVHTYSVHRAQSTYIHMYGYCTHTHMYMYNSASEKGYLELVQYLLDNRAIAVSNPVSHHTALHLACHHGHTDVVIALLDRLPALLAIDDSTGETSLHIASREGHVEIVRNLLAVAARAEQLKSLERSNSSSGKSDDVSLYGSGNERVQRNLEHLDSLGEVTVDIMAPSASDRRTPLHEAAMTGHVEVVKLIVEFMREFHGRRKGGASSLSPPNDRDGGGGGGGAATSPSRADRASPMTLKRSAGGPSQNRPRAVPGVDEMTLRGRTAFHEAAKAGHFGVMSTLLEAGADINAYMRPALDTSINADLTALVQACLMNRADIVQFLLKNGATDARLKALSRSLRQSFDAVAGLLLSYNGGAHTIVKDSRSSDANKKKKLALVSVEWNSKKLRYVREAWLHTVLREVPVPRNQTAVISHIDISSNELTELPVALFQLKHLIKLEAGRNKLTALPVCLRDAGHQSWDCPKLNELDISSNTLTSLPPQLFQLLPELKELNAGDNRITEVDTSVWTAPKLAKLFLGRNKLTAFPSTDFMGVVSAAVATPTTRGEESGYQSGQHNPAPHFSLLSGSHASRKKSLVDSQNQFDESLGVWGRRRKSLGLQSGILAGGRGGVNFGRDPRRMSVGSLQSSVISWRFKNFQDTNFDLEDLDDIDSESAEEGSEGYTLEHLDLSRNMLTSVPSGLSCLAPKLQKLNLSHNRIRGLGHLNDYPPNLELFDASHNELCAAISEPAATQTLSLPCARKALTSSLSTTTSSTSSLLLESISSPTSALKPCAHRLHKNLQKLSTVRLSRNQLVDLQLFRMVSRSTRVGDLTSSLESSIPNKQKTVTNDPFAVRVSPGSAGRKEMLSKSMSAPHSKEVTGGQGSPTTPMKRGVKWAGSGDLGDGVRGGIARGGGGGHSSNSSNSAGSQEDSGSGVQSPASMIISPLFPVLSTLELAHNDLHSVPSNLHLVSNLACLVLSHNPIESLPLELSNLDHLWNLEYEGCNLTFPPKEDLDKYRLAADKLLYMKSLLHE